MRGYRTDTGANTFTVLADGSATFGGGVEGLYFTADRTSGTNTVLQGYLNGSETSKITADGNATFAGTITGTLSGTATNATNVNLRARNTTDAVHYITFSTSSTGNQRLNTDTTLKYNPNTNTLSVTNFDGNATTATNATNAGTLDGYDSAIAATGSTVVVRDSDGDIAGRDIEGSYMGMSHSSSTRNSDTIFYSSTDTYIRKNSASGFRTSLNVPTRTGGNASGTWGISISGNAATASSATNADKLDNIDSSQFLRSDTGDQKTSGTLRFNDSVICAFGTNNDFEIFHNNTHAYMDINKGNLYIRDDTTTRFTFDDAGHFTATGDLIANSDIKLKKNIETLENPIEKVKQLRGVRYDRVDIEKDNCIGVIAQEVEEIYPEFVSEGEDGTKGVDYSKMVAVLIEAVKEQQKQIDELKLIINK